MIIRDVMPAFELHQPTQLLDAFALLDRFGKDAWKMAGGYDSLSWFKERVKRPKAVIDLSGIAEMKGVKETPDGGVEIGALTTLVDIERNAVIKAKYRVLAEAAGLDTGHFTIPVHRLVEGTVPPGERWQASLWRELLSDVAATQKTAGKLPPSRAEVHQAFLRQMEQRMELDAHVLGLDFDNVNP